MGSLITECEAHAVELIRVLLYLIKVCIGWSVERGNGRESG